MLGVVRAHAMNNAAELVFSVIWVGMIVFWLGMLVYAAVMTVSDYWRGDVHG